MRVDVEKYLVIGPWIQKSTFYERVQELGIMEFINPKNSLEEPSSEVQTFTEALHILRRRPPVKQSVPAEDYRSANVLARHIVERSHEIERLKEQARVLDKEIARVKPFGNFSPEEVQRIESETHRKIQFFFAKSGAEIEAKQHPEVIYLTSAYNLDYFVAINNEPTSYPGMVEIHIEKPLGQLEEEQAEVRNHIQAFESDLATLSHQQKLIRQGLNAALNQYHLEQSKTRAESFLNGDVFAAEGWVPKNRILELQKLCDELELICEPTQVEKEDRVPTHLENEGFSRLGEDLVGIYDIPSTGDRDPSLWVFIAFGIFFSMIVADAGYGVLLLGISLFLFFKFGKKGGLARRVIFLAMSLSVGCIIWGILTASYLGIEVPMDSPLRKVSFVDWVADKKAAYIIKSQGQVYQDLIKKYPDLKNIKDPHEFLLHGGKIENGKMKYVVHDELVDNILMELVIFIGTIHIIISFLRYIDKNWSGAGWIIFMVGAYLYFPSILKATSLIHYLFGIPAVEGAKIGFYLIFIGIGLAALLAMIQRKLAGLGEVMHVIQIFADVMSYLRIYALSLAGVIMASTFDKIGTSMPLYFGIFILLAGHTINFVLAMMGGIIHGLRLNFIEWYHYSFEGGGKRFQPLSLFKIE